MSHQGANPDGFFYFQKSFHGNRRRSHPARLESLSKRISRRREVKVTLRLKSRRSSVQWTDCFGQREAENQPERILLFLPLTTFDKNGYRSIK